MTEHIRSLLDKGQYICGIFVDLEKEFDKYLPWNYQIDHLSKKLGRVNGILSKFRYNATIETTLQVYYAIFYSHLIYGYDLWL